MTTSSPAVKACDYVPDESDDIDLELSECLKGLRPDLASRLRLARKARGSYEIEGRHVSLRRVEDDDGELEEDDIVVCEEDMRLGTVPTPLETYLEQSAHVATFMAHNTGAQQTKKDLTFGDARIPDDTDPFTARLMCMRLACDQAEQRQGYSDSQALQEASRQAAVQRMSSANAGGNRDSDTVYTRPPMKEEPASSWWETFTSQFMRSDDPEESEDESRP